jgi:hypothetical protein
MTIKMTATTIGMMTAIAISMAIGTATSTSSIRSMNSRISD